MANPLLEVIKQISNESVEAGRPVKVLFGTVTGVSPLQITVEQKLVLPEEFLILSRNVTDYTVNMEVNHVTEKMSGGAKDPSFVSHLHQYKGVKPFKVLNALKMGEGVALIAVQGGQKYFVIDRV